MALMMNAFEFSAYVLSLVCHEQEKLSLANCTSSIEGDHLTRVVK